MTTTDIAQKLHKTLADYFAGELPFFDAELPDTASLMDQGLDSMRVLELILFLEEEFDVSVEDDEISRKNLDSLQSLTSFVLEKLGMVPHLPE